MPSDEIVLFLGESYQVRLPEAAAGADTGIDYHPANTTLRENLGMVGPVNRHFGA
jgi:hypothetical protein